MGRNYYRRYSIMRRYACVLDAEGSKLNDFMKVGVERLMGAGAVVRKSERRFKLSTILYYLYRVLLIVVICVCSTFLFMPNFSMDKKLLVTIALIIALNIIDLILFMGLKIDIYTLLFHDHWYVNEYKKYKHVSDRRDVLFAIYRLMDTYYLTKLFDIQCPRLYYEIECDIASDAPSEYSELTEVKWLLSRIHDIAHGNVDNVDDQTKFEIKILMNIFRLYKPLRYAIVKLWSDGIISNEVLHLYGLDELLEYVYKNEKNVYDRLTLSPAFEKDENGNVDVERYLDLWCEFED